MRSARYILRTDTTWAYKPLAGLCVLICLALAGTVNAQSGSLMRRPLTAANSDRSTQVDASNPPESSRSISGALRSRESVLYNQETGRLLRPDEYYAATGAISAGTSSQNAATGPGGSRLLAGASSAVPEYGSGAPVQRWRSTYRQPDSGSSYGGSGLWRDISSGSTGRSSVSGYEREPVIDRWALPRSDEPMVSGDYRGQFEDLRRQLAQIQADTAELKRNMNRQGSLQQQSQYGYNSSQAGSWQSVRSGAPGYGYGQGYSGYAQPLNPNATAPQATMPNETEMSLPDLIAALQAEQDAAQAALQQQRASQYANQGQPYGMGGGSSQAGQIDALFSTQSPNGYAAQSYAQGAGGYGAGGTTQSPVAPQQGMAQPQDLDAFYRTQFEQYVREAESHFKAGRFLQAADAYTQASICEPMDVSIHVGKSIALFAAGEYMSSAFYLARGVELDPDYVLQRWDLITMSGGPDAFIARFSELAERIKTDSSPLLQFLLAYVYHQMDRPLEAQKAISVAEQGLPGLMSVNLLRIAVGG